MDIAIFTSGARLKAHPDYIAAKAGDYRAAFRLAEETINRVKAEALVLFLPPGACILPVTAEEASGRNKIPLAFAAFLSSISGKDLSVERKIFQLNLVRHTGANAMSRLLSKPLFAGPVTPGKSYLIVDDFVTSGSSLNELRHYVQTGEGMVVGVAALAAAFSPQTGHARILDITDETMGKINAKFKLSELNHVLNAYGIAENIKALTNSQARYLLTFKDVNAIRAAVLAARNRRKLPGNGATF